MWEFIKDPIQWVWPDWAKVYEQIYIDKRENRSLKLDILQDVTFWSTFYESLFQKDFNYYSSIKLNQMNKISINPSGNDIVE